MAGEYSRELAVKVLQGKKRLAGLGFRAGGFAGIGMRRMMVSADGKRKQVLQRHEYKRLQTDRIILVPGPKREVACVREIFEMATKRVRPTPSPTILTREGLRMKVFGGAPDP